MRVAVVGGTGLVGRYTTEALRSAPPLLIQPVAASDVGQVLADVATGPPVGGVHELAGPEPQDLVDMARRTLAARGESIRLVPGWRDGPLVVLPGPDAQIAPTTFDAWLAGAGVSGSGPR